jgi:N-acetylglucosaminyldiphosphoundecaprenol N-acetyl-beta-D-mannosaminyltransferase
VKPTDNPNQPDTVNVLGTPLCVTSYEEFSSFCHERVKQSDVFSVDFTNTQIVTMRRTEDSFRRLTESVDYFVPDGMPLIWCMNRAEAGMQDRVYGPTFLRECLIRTKSEYTHYFLGGSKECLERLCERSLEQNAGLTICGTRDGYFCEDQEEGIVAEINELSPDFIWIGLGTPKQQAWINRWKPKIKRGGILAVGYAFDVNAGTKADPPLWMQRFGLGWAFRLASEPKRLAGRYLKYNSLFLFFLFWDGLWGRAIRRDEGNLSSDPDLL